MFPTRSSGPGSSSTGAVGHRDDDALDAALGVDEEIRERAYLLAVEADLLPLEIGERAAPDGVEAEPAVEQDECGPDRDPLVADLARREGQESGAHRHRS